MGFSRLGVGQLLVPHYGGGITYLLRDEFTTDRTAGNVNGTAAEPGPDSRVVIDPDGLMTTSSGALIVSGTQAVASDATRPSIRYRAVPRNSISKILVATVTPTTLRGPDDIGFYKRVTNGNSAYSVRFISQGFYANVNNAVTAKLANYVNGTTYQVAVILKQTGGEIWVKGGAFSVWTQIHSDNTAASSIVVIPAIGWFTYNVTVASSVNFLQLCKYAGGSLDTYFNELPDSGRAGKNVLLIGDSKTVLTNAWKLPDYSSTNATAFSEMPTRIATTGWTVALAQAAIDAALAAATGTPDQCWINLGANDVAALPAEATWKANMLYILDAINTKWPSCQCYLMRVWRRGEAADCNTLAGWIADVVASRSTFCHLGPDERVFLENGDDGTLRTTDGLHYTAAAYDVAAVEWAVQ